MDYTGVHGLDYQEGLRRFSNNQKLYEKFLATFLKDPTFDQALNAYEAGDMEALLLSVHTLKGLAGNLSMNCLYAACCEVVSALRGREEARARELFEAVIKEYRKMCEQLR